MAEEQEWANLLAEIFDKLTQKHASITYDFENLEMQGKGKGQQAQKFSVTYNEKPAAVQKQVS